MSDPSDKHCGFLSPNESKGNVWRTYFLVVLLIGPPGSGKGTQASRLKQWLEIPAISTGDLFRLEIGKKTKLGMEAEKVINQGLLVEDLLVQKMLQTRLTEPDCSRGFLLDGYPRTVVQAIYLSELLAKAGRPEPLVLHIDVPAELLIARMSSRRGCSLCGRIYNLLNTPPRAVGVCDDDGSALLHREDDRGEVIRQRLEAYETWTRPVVEHYANGSYYKVDGNRPPSEVFVSIAEGVNRHRTQLQQS